MALQQDLDRSFQKAWWEGTVTLFQGPLPSKTPHGHCCENSTLFRQDGRECGGKRSLQYLIVSKAILYLLPYLIFVVTVGWEANILVSLLRRLSISQEARKNRAELEFRPSDSLFSKPLYPCYISFFFDYIIVSAMCSISSYYSRFLKRYLKNFF